MKATPAAAELLPIFLKLSGRPVLVVGGGRVAAEKVATLLPTGAAITVVAPEIDPAILRMAVSVRRRPVTIRDLSKVWLVISAATPDVNRWVSRAVTSRRVFINAVDDPGNATAYLGGVVRRAGVTIAISTGGRAPALAALLRQALDALLPNDLRRWMSEADRLRLSWRAGRVPWRDRRPQLANAIAALYPTGTSRRKAAERA